MSLLTGMLACNDQPGAEVRLGVLLGSLVSAAAGYAWLRITTRAPAAPASGQQDG